MQQDKNIIQQPPQNILIIKLSAIGDVVHALPVTHALKKAWPQAKITWVVGQVASEIVTNNPDLDEIILFDKKRLKSLGGIISYARELKNLLQAKKIDLALDLQGLFKSGAVAWLSGASCRLVYCNSREGSGWLSKRVCGPNQQGHIVERLLDTVRFLGIDPGKPVFPLVVTALESTSAVTKAVAAGLDLLQPYVVLLLGANWPNKRWPLTAFAAVIAWLQARGIKPVLAGGESENLLALELQKLLEPALQPVNLIGQTSLKELVHILRYARVCVGGDTGPMHLAAAAGTKVIGLYGPTDIRRNGPYGEEHAMLSTSYACAGCWQRKCPKGKDCLAEIKVEEVYAKLEKILL